MEIIWLPFPFYNFINYLPKTRPLYKYIKWSNKVRKLSTKRIKRERKWVLAKFVLFFSFSWLLLHPMLQAMVRKLCPLHMFCYLIHMKIFITKYLYLKLRIYFSPNFFLKSELLIWNKIVLFIVFTFLLVQKIAKRILLHLF